MDNFKPNEHKQRKNLLKKIIKRITAIIFLKTFVARRKINFLKSILEKKTKSYLDQ